MLRGLLTFATAVVATLVLGTAAIVGGLLVPGGNVTNHVARLWSRIVLAVAGIRPTYRGLEHAGGTSPRIFLANHLSNIDIPAVAIPLPNTCRFVAKRSLFWLPIFGQAMWIGGFVPIDRGGDRSRAIRSLGRVAERIRAGASVILFPEGTRSRTGKLAPFKKGAFHLALEAQVPVVPIAISGSYELNKPRSPFVRSGPVRVTFFPPIDPARYGPDGLAPLMEDVRATIASGLRPDEVS